MISGPKLIKPLSWEEVFSIWEKHEANLPHWIEHYTKRGFESWKDWRNSSIKDLKLETMTWNLYEIVDPIKIVPDFHAGPFRAWIKKYYGGNKTVTFKEIAHNVEMQSDHTIHEIISSFPEDTTIIGLQNEELTIIDGLHRCCALAVANEKGIVLAPKLFIACAVFSGELPLLGQENSPT
ncbi:MAG: hypothetical protein WDZ88_03985 [Candidatus Paceibacterota bacterium]